MRKLKKKIKKKKYMEANENENTRVQNLWDEAKEVIRGKEVSSNIILFKKQEKS